MSTTCAVLVTDWFLISPLACMFTAETQVDIIEAFDSVDMLNIYNICFDQTGDKIS